MNRFDRALSEATLSMASFIGPEPPSFELPREMATSALIESEVATAEPAPAVFYPNRQMRRALGIEGTVMHGQPDELATAVNGVLAALHHRSKSKQEDPSRLSIVRSSIADTEQRTVEAQVRVIEDGINLLPELGVQFNWQLDASEHPQEEAPPPEPSEAQATVRPYRIVGLRMACYGCEVAWTGPLNSECWYCDGPGTPGPPPTIYPDLD